ncbi:MAG TPA: L-seryl-tRNA(Sec) selenium transferase [Vicinamibacterales bacterium]|jgi:L-seryl-tRNA(Ser) seleniumtransferase
MRSIPSIEQLRQRPALLALEATYGRTAIVEALRAEAAAIRQRPADASPSDDVVAAIERGTIERLASVTAASLRRVINATGVIIHTNLGRAPLARSAAERIALLSAGYTNLEYDLTAGSRGTRDTHAERLLCRLTGAEAAVVVNNNAAATMLTLAALAAGREVIISRGELVEIGGGFRVPDVLAQSGAILREVGTTNRTRAADYAAAVNDRTAICLRVHPSNFRIEGFTERPSLADLVELGRRFKLAVVEDVGSGYLDSPRSTDDGEPGRAALHDEPRVSDSVAAGADVVMFSGDKLLGGPQAGIVVGRRDLIGRIRSHPLMRALRVDKLTYAALEATLEEYAAGRERTTVPVAAMIAMPIEAIEQRARALADALAHCGVRATTTDGVSTIGGGSAPGATLPTCLVAVEHPSRSANELEQWLRDQAVPIIARIERHRLVLDLRTVDPIDDDRIASAFDRSRT